MAMIGNNAPSFQTNRPYPPPGLDALTLSPLPAYPLLNKFPVPSQSFESGNRSISPSVPADSATHTNNVSPSPETPMSSALPASMPLNALKPDSPSLPANLPQRPASPSVSVQPLSSAFSPFNQPLRPFEQPADFSHIMPKQSINPAPTVNNRPGTNSTLGIMSPQNTNGVQGANNTPDVAANQIAANPASSVGAQQPNSAEVTGEKIGQIATALLEAKPNLQEFVDRKVNEIDIDAFKNNVDLYLDKAKATVKPIVDYIPHIADSHIVRFFSPSDQPMVKKLLAELRKAPEPVEPPLLPTRPNRARPADLEEDLGSADEGPSSEVDEPPARKEAPPKKSMLNNLKSKVWPFNQKEELAPERPVHKRRPPAERPEINDDELETKLNDALGQPGGVRPPIRRPRPMDDAVDEKNY